MARTVIGVDAATIFCRSRLVGRANGSGEQGASYFAYQVIVIVVPHRPGIQSGCHTRLRAVGD